MMDLDGILDPLPTAEFLSRYFHRRFCHIAGHRAKFQKLLPWSVLNSILRHHTLDSPQIRVFKEGQLIPAESYIASEAVDGALNSRISRVSGPELTKHLREGATLIIDKVDQMHEPLTIMAQRLERRFQVPVTINTFAGWRASQGFNLHWDDTDGFVLQVAGKKRWTVYEPTHSCPLPFLRGMYGESDRPISLVWDGVLEAGDLLYIPRGYWHVAYPLDDPTLHLNVGLATRTGLNILPWLTQRLAEDERMRVDLPLLADADEQSRYLEGFRAAILSACSDPELLTKYKRANLHAEPRPMVGFPWSVTPSLLPELPDQHQLVWVSSIAEVRQSIGSDTVELDFRGQTFTFPAQAKQLIEFLQDAERVSLETFYQKFEAVFGRDELGTFLTELVQHGIVCPAGLEDWDDSAAPRDSNHGAQLRTAARGKS
jgi:ribosomal protein L16 Arg81 hydroxylase